MSLFSNSNSYQQLDPFFSFAFIQYLNKFVNINVVMQVNKVKNTQ